MNDPAAVVSVILITTTASAYVIRVVASSVLKWKEKQLEAQRAPSVSDVRLERLEVAVESIALEIERISEGQRFTTKLLNDAAQHSMPRLDKPAKMNTPH